MAAVGTGVTVGSRTIRVVEVRRQKSGAWQVTKALIAPVSDTTGSDARRAAEAKAALQTSGAKGGALVGLSGKDLIIRYTQVPPVPDWRLEMLMNFEIQEVSEQSGGDVSAAYAPLAIDDATSGDNVVLVALAKNGHLVPRLEAVREAGLDVIGGCPRSVAAFAVYKEHGRLPSDETVFLMHIGHENTDVAISRKGVLIFARNVAGGSRLFTDAIVQNIRLDPATAEKSKITKGNLTPRGKAKYRDSAEEKIANTLMGVAGHFVSAYNSSLMFARAQTKVPDCQPSKVVLMGSGALLKGLPEYLESNLGLPVELFDPIPSVDLSALPEKTAEALKQDQGGLAVTPGLAQMAADPKSFRVEVLPAADKKKRHFMRHTAVTIAAAALLAGGLAASWVMLAGASARAQGESELLAQKGVTYGKNDADMESAKRRVEQANFEMDQLARLVSLGPVFQQTTDLVHTIVNDEKDGFPEIHLLKATAKFVPVSIEIPGSTQVHAEKVGEITIEAKVESLGARQPAQTYTDFVNQLQSRISAISTLKVSINQLVPASNSFAFQIRSKSSAEMAQEKPQEKQ